MGSQFIDREDAEDVLIEIEKSLKIKFHSNELTSVINLGELCDFIQTKIDLQNTSDCTTRQAFYKLRNVLSANLNLAPKNIHLNSELKNLLPKKNRRTIVKKIDNELGFKTKILTIHNLLFFFLLFGLIGSIITIFFHFIWGWAGFAFFAASMKIASDFGKELNVKTVRELTEKITREHYQECRKNPTTVNMSEIEKLVIDSFNHYLGENFTRKAVFG